MRIEISEDSKLLAGINEECLFSNDGVKWVSLLFAGFCDKTGLPVGKSDVNSKLYSTYNFIKDVWER
jgi:hypothetical protein